MTLKILQWNMNGYRNNYNELQILLRTYSPRILCIQETHVHDLTNLCVPINYTIYARNTSNTRYGGVAILVHNSLQHRQINLGRDQGIDTICVEITSRIKFNIFSSYIKPDQNFTKNHLNDTFRGSIYPDIITGDFNSWHSHWGSPTINSRGRILAGFINDSEYVILNNNSPTHFSTHGSFSHVDLTFCSPSVALYSDWQTLDSMHGSDHYPILISLFQNANANTPNTNFIPKFKTELANWNLFKTKCLDFESIRHISDNVNQEAANISKIILQAANIAIPQSRKIINKKVPWWNNKLQILKIQKNRSWSTYKREMSIANLVNFRKIRAQYKREIKLTKLKSIHDLGSTINPSTPIAKIWSNIRNFTGFKATNSIHCVSKLNNPDIILTDRLDIAQEFESFWSDNSQTQSLLKIL